jgi:hypothetical protein
VCPETVFGGGGLHGAGDIGAEDVREVVCEEKTFVPAVGVVGEDCGAVRVGWEEWGGRTDVELRLLL